MRRISWPVAWLLVIQLIAAVPASAAGPVTTDAQINMTVVDDPGSRQNLPLVLSRDEARKVSRLQNAAVRQAVASPLSPDGQAILMIKGNQLGFLNVQEPDSFLALDPRAAFARFTPLALLGIGSFGWADDVTLVSIGTESRQRAAAPSKPGAAPPERSTETVPAIVAINRLTGQVGGKALENFPRRNAIPLSVAPNGSRILFVRLKSGSLPAAFLTKTRITWPLNKQLDMLPLLGQLQEQMRGQLGQNAELQQWLEASDVFEAESGELTSLAIELALSIYDVATDTIVDIRDADAGTLLLPGLSWSADGRRLALSLSNGLDAAEEPDGRRVARDERPYDGALLSEQVYRDVTGQLPPDQNPLFQKNTVEVFNVESSGVQTIKAVDGDGSLIQAAGFSPDGQQLMVKAWTPGRVAGRDHPIYTPQFVGRSYFRFYNEELSQTGRLDAPELNGPFAAVGRFISSSEVIFQGIVGSDVRVFYYHRGSGEFRDIATMAGVHLSLSVAPRTRQMIFQFSSYTHPPAIYRMNVDGQALARLTWENYELETFSQTRQYPVQFSLSNGEKATGTLIQPADLPFPPSNNHLIVWQEGGPGGQVFNSWAAIVERPFALLPNFGFSLLIVPLTGREGVPGRGGLGPLADNNNFGQIDIDLQAEIVRQMIDRGWTSAGKIGITGCSYGGYFVWQSVIRHPDLYTAGNPQCAGPVDVFVEWSRGYATLLPYLEGQAPFAKPDEYRRDSPIYNADKVKAAILTFHGTNDFLPITLNENLHYQLVQRGVPARMIAFVGAGHGLVGRTSLIENYELFAGQEMIAWFRQHLK